LGKIQNEIDIISRLKRNASLITGTNRRPFGQHNRVNYSENLVSHKNIIQDNIASQNSSHLSFPQSSCDLQTMSFDLILKYYEAIGYITKMVEELCLNKMSMDEPAIEDSDTHMESQKLGQNPNIHVYSESVNNAFHNYGILLRCHKYAETRSFWFKIQIIEIYKYVDMRILLYVDLRRYPKMEIKPMVYVYNKCGSVRLLNELPNVEIEITLLSNILGYVCTPTTVISLNGIMKYYKEYNSVICPITVESSSHDKEEEFCMLKKLMNIHHENHKATIYNENEQPKMNKETHYEKKDYHSTSSSHSSQSFDSSEEIYTENSECQDQEFITVIAEIKTKIQCKNTK